MGLLHGKEKHLKREWELGNVDKLAELSSRIRGESAHACRSTVRGAVLVPTRLPPTALTAMAQWCSRGQLQVSPATN